MFNELEIITWCFTIYLLLNYTDVEQYFRDNGKLGGEVKFCNRDELVLAAAIFAKVSNQFVTFKRS
jgi:hypothetical protein